MPSISRMRFGAEFEVGEVRQGREVLDLGYAVLHEVEVVEFCEGGDVFDVFQLVVADV